ncbi:MAG: hypothetical protein JNK99_13610 [Candidatus Accumulibacter sp.]|uniref:hypothetical protein n=1 Tax=Accumulibacter sp. TaxID=2053492 RepID=UPI001A41BC11|nr:hypothetical protein [Accumulibacter sp.]MBL8395762.1 hypothetical protein [Accumulibacter sp.]
MQIPDDPALSFFREPAGNFPESCFSETEFLERQVAAIEAYVEHFPADERELRALAWIEANASQYRHWWQLQVASGRY